MKLPGKLQSIFFRLLNYFVQGLLYTAPISITIYVFVKAFGFIDNILPLKIPGLGIMVILTLITLVGFLASSLIGRPVAAYLIKLIEKTPLIKDIYSSIKDLVSAFVGKKKKFSEPVLVKMNDTGLEKLGFVTHRDLAELGISGNKIAVYLPYSYGIMGSLYIVEEKNITPINSSSTQVMKFIVSGGVIQPPDKDDDTEQIK